MKPVIIVGTAFVHLALIAYGIGIIAEQRCHRISRRILVFLGLGLAFDIAATACMIIGSSHGFISQHGLLGYSCLLAMAADTGLVLRHWVKHQEKEVPRILHLFSRYAYLWWVLGAYVTGGLLVFIRVSLKSL